MPEKLRLRVQATYLYGAGLCHPPPRTPQSPLRLLPVTTAAAAAAPVSWKITNTSPVAHSCYFYAFHVSCHTYPLEWHSYTTP